MARLPQPGGDNGNWGTILNDYLSQSHGTDGSLKADSVSATQIQDGSVQEAQLASAVQSKLNAVAPTWSTLSGKPAVIGAGTDAAAARDAIGAGSASDLAAKAPVLDLYVDDFAPDAFAWGVDDTAPWQAAIDAARDASGVVRIHAKPGRVYKLNPLKVYSSTIIEGHQTIIQPITRVGGSNIWDAVIYMAGCAPANGCTGDDTTVVNDVEIRDFVIDTEGKAYSTINVQNANRVTVRSCQFPSNQNRIAIWFGKSTDECLAEDNRIISTLDSPFGTIVNAQGISCSSTVSDSTGGAYGPYGSGTVDSVTFIEPTNLSQRHKIINNWIEGGTHGIALSGAEGCLVQGNTINNTSHRGVILSVASRNVITGNSVRGNFSCAYLLCFGSRFNLIGNNFAYCTDSVSELNGYRASYGSSDNMFSGNYAYGVAGAAYRAFTGSINNSFIGNKAENCGVGIEFRSLNVDSGYWQNINTPAMTGNTAQGNHFINCATGIALRSGTTTSSGTTPATTAGISVPLRSCSIVGNTVQGAASYGSLFTEDTVGSVTLIVAAGNAMIGNTSDWQTPRNNGHFTSFVGNNGAGMPAIVRLPAAGNGTEWRDQADALKAYVGPTGSIVSYGRGARGSSTASTIAVDYVSTTGTSQIGLRVDGVTSQAVDIQQWTLNAGPSTVVTPVSRISPTGAFVTSVHSAPVDANLANGEMAVWFDQTNGAAKLMIKAKQADGTVRTGTVELT